MILAKLKLAATATVVALGGAGLTVGGWAYTTAQVPGGLGGPPGVEKPIPSKAAFVKPGGPTPTTPPEEPRRITLAQVRRSQANLKLLILGMHAYHDAFSKLPTDLVATDKAITPLLSWRVAILPYIGEQKLYDQFKIDQPWDSESNLKLLSKMPDCLRVGFEPNGSTHTYYQVFSVVGAALFPADLAVSVPGGPGGPDLVQQIIRVPQLTRITDGSSNTIGVVECGPPVPWTKPADIVIADLLKPLPSLAWPFKEAIVVGMMDGTALALDRKMTEPHLREMVTAAGGEIVADNDLAKKFRLRLPATTAEEKALLEKARAEIAATHKLLQVEVTEYFRLIQEAANDDLLEFEEINRNIKRNLADHIAKNKELAAPKK